MVKKFNELMEEALNESTIILDTVDPKDKDLLKYLKKNKIKMKIVNPNGPGGGAPEVEYTGKKDALAKMTNDLWGDDLAFLIKD